MCSVLRWRAVSYFGRAAFVSPCVFVLIIYVQVSRKSRPLWTVLSSVWVKRVKEDAPSQVADKLASERWRVTTFICRSTEQHSPTSVSHDVLCGRPIGALGYMRNDSKMQACVYGSFSLSWSLGRSCPVPGVSLIKVLQPNSWKLEDDLEHVYALLCIEITFPEPTDIIPFVWLKNRAF